MDHAKTICPTLTTALLLAAGCYDGGLDSEIIVWRITKSSETDPAAHVPHQHRAANSGGS